jgi:hypothetical protein
VNAVKWLAKRVAHAQRTKQRHAEARRALVRRAKRALAILPPVRACVGS